MPSSTHFDIAATNSIEKATLSKILPLLRLFPSDHNQEGRESYNVT